MSVDPVVGSAGDPQSWNSYTYVRNNPLRLVDPSGMVAECFMFCTGSPDQLVIDENEQGQTVIYPQSQGPAAAQPVTCDTACEVAGALLYCAANPVECGSAAPSSPVPVQLPTPSLPPAGPGSDGGGDCWLCDLVGEAKDLLEDGVEGVMVGLEIFADVDRLYECYELASSTVVVGGMTAVIGAATVGAVVATAEAPPVAVAIGAVGLVGTAAGGGATVGVGYSAYRVCTGRAGGTH